MDNVISSRRINMFAASHGVQLQSGLVYPRAKLSELLVDILQACRGLHKRAAASSVREAMAPSRSVSLS